MKSEQVACLHPNRKYVGSGPYEIYWSHWCPDCGALIRSNSEDAVRIRGIPEEVVWLPKSLYKEECIPSDNCEVECSAHPSDCPKNY